MKKIFVDKKEFQFTGDNLPMLIHGEDHAGASFYTISLIANLFLQGSKILVLCGYSMAEEQFRKQVGDFRGEVAFYTKDQISDFLKAVSSLRDIDERIVLLKNVELFDGETANFVSEKKKYIISGDFNKCAFREKVLEKLFATKIFFSPLSEVEIPYLNKYEGFFISNFLNGITKVEI
jgi:hypothetical protein